MGHTHFTRASNASLVTQVFDECSTRRWRVDGTRGEGWMADDGGAWTESKTNARETAVRELFKVRKVGTTPFLPPTIRDYLSELFSLSIQYQYQFVMGEFTPLSNLL